MAGARGLGLKEGSPRGFRQHFLPEIATSGAGRPLRQQHQSAALLVPRGLFLADAPLLGKMGSDVTLRTGACSSGAARGSETVQRPVSLMVPDPGTSTRRAPGLVDTTLQCHRPPSGGCPRSLPCTGRRRQMGEGEERMAGVRGSRAGSVLKSSVWGACPDPWLSQN